MKGVMVQTCITKKPNQVNGPVLNIKPITVSYHLIEDNTLDMLLEWSSRQARSSRLTAPRCTSRRLIGAPYKLCRSVQNVISASNVVLWSPFKDPAAYRGIHKYMNI